MKDLIMKEVPLSFASDKVVSKVLDELVTKTGCDDHTEVVKQSIAYFAIMLRFAGESGVIHISNDDGEQKHICLIKKQKNKL